MLVFILSLLFVHVLWKICRVETIMKLTLAYILVITYEVYVKSDINNIKNIGDVVNALHSLYRN